MNKKSKFMNSKFMETFDGITLFFICIMCIGIGLLIAFALGNDRALTPDEICQLKGFDESDTRYQVVGTLNTGNENCLEKDYRYKGLMMTYCKMPIYIEDSKDNWCQKQAIDRIKEIQLNE